MKGYVWIAGAAAEEAQPIARVQVVEQPVALANGAHLDEDGLADVSDGLPRDTASKTS